MQAKILIFEDDPLTLKEMRHHLKGAGYTHVTAVSNLSEAVHLIETDFPDIAILDINTPEDREAGIKLAQKINARRAIPIVFVTGYHAEEDLKKRAFETSPAAFLPKPFKEDTVMAQIDLAVHKLAEKEKENLGKIASEPLYRYGDYVCIKKGNVYHAMQVKDITYVEAKEGVIHIATAKGTFQYSSTLAAFQQQIQAEYFVKAHRSLIVNLLFMDGFSVENIIIRGKSFAISKDFYNQLHHKIPILKTKLSEKNGI